MPLLEKIFFYNGRGEWPAMAAAPGPEPRPPVSSPSSITPRDISGMWNFLQGIYRLSTPRPATY